MTDTPAPIDISPVEVEAVIADLKSIEDGCEFPQLRDRDQRGRAGQLWRLIDALRQSATAAGWQPMETAPKDQGLLLVDTTPVRFMGYWNEKHQGWFDNNGNRRTVTHWIDPGYPEAQS